MYWAAFSAFLLNAPSNVSRAHCNVCSIALGKFFNVQIGMLFSGGSCVALYDSVTNGTTTCAKMESFKIHSKDSAAAIESNRLNSPEHFP